MQITKEEVYDQLKEIIDPELHINIVDLGLIYNVEIDQEKGEVQITMTLTSPGCPLSMVFEQWIPDAVKKVPGVQAVRINLVWDPPWNPDTISDEVKEDLGILR